MDQTLQTGWIDLRRVRQERHRLVETARSPVKSNRIGDLLLPSYYYAYPLVLVVKMI